MNEEIMAKIKQRRLQILVHSCIYYEYDTNIISDSQWNSWAHELVELQAANPEESKVVEWAQAFENFNGSTGMDLPIKDTWVMNKAMELLHYKGECQHGNVPVEQNEYLMPLKKSKKSVKQHTMKRRKLF